MESLITTQQEGNLPEVTPGLEIVPTKEEKPMTTPGLIIDKGIREISDLIKEKGDEDKIPTEEPHTLH